MELDQEAVAASLRTLELLERWERQRESMPPLPAQRPSRPKAPSVKDVRFKLAEAWVLLSEARESIQDWKQRASTEVGFTLMDAKLRQCMMEVDGVLYELESPTDRKNRR